MNENYYIYYVVDSSFFSDEKKNESNSDTGSQGATSNLVNLVSRYLPLILILLLILAYKMVK